MFANPYPLEGKYKDEEDREKLLKMTEIEREQVLFSRAEEMQRFKEKRDLAALVKQQSKDQPRRSGREGQLRSEKAGKRDGLSELVKRREERSNAQKVKVFLFKGSLKLTFRLPRRRGMLVMTGTRMRNRRWRVENTPRTTVKRSMNPV